MHKIEFFSTIFQTMDPNVNSYTFTLAACRYIHRWALFLYFLKIVFFQFFFVFKICNNWHTRFALYSFQCFNAIVVSFLNFVVLCSDEIGIPQKVYFFISFFLLSFHVVLFSNLLLYAERVHSLQSISLVICIFS